MRLFEVQLIRYGQYCEENDEIWVSQDLPLEKVMEAIQFCLSHPEWCIGWTGIQIDERIDVLPT